MKEQLKNPFQTCHTISPPSVSRNSCACWVPGCDVTDDRLSLQTINNENLWVWLQLPGTQRVQEFLLTQGESCCGKMRESCKLVRNSQSSILWEENEMRSHVSMVCHAKSVTSLFSMFIYIWRNRVFSHFCNLLIIFESGNCLGCPLQW